MKTNKLFKRILTIIVFTFFSSSLFAQFGELGQVLAAGQGDAEKIFETYLTPYANGIGAGLSTGWYTTAKAHKLGGFDLNVSFNLTFIPTADQSYDASELGLGDPANGLTAVVASGKSPTAAGSGDGQLVDYSQDVLGIDVPIAQLNLPRGTGFPYTPVPMIQLGLGLVKETDILVRYSPSLEWGNGSKISLWGVGLKHSVSQWIPGLKKLPVFDMSLQGGYTKLNSKNALDFQASFYDDFADVVFDNEDLYSGQELMLDVSNITANLIVSGDFKIICIYGGVGISSTTSNLKLNGYYPFPEVNGTQIIVDDNTAKKDPIDITIKSTDGGVTKPRFNAGLRFKFAVVTINFDYTYANYSVASAGLGISFR
ncbi:MAG: hypothetical protein KAR57_04995 [Bacteroidales bacterium]|nr:hypothetical protein [Bacteroidales bacterium]